MKKLASIVMAAIMAVSMAGCATSTAKPASSAAAPAAAPAAPAAPAAEANGTTYAKRTIKVSTSGNDQGIDALSAKYFGDLVNQKSGGAITVEVYPNCQLAGGDMSKLIELLVAGGNYEMMVGSGSVLGNVDEQFLTHTIPFLFGSYDEAASYLDGTGGEYYAKMMADKGMVYMAGEYNGLRQLTTKDKVVTKPEDLKAMRIRVPSGEVYMKTLTDMGADPVAMNWSEVFTALQQGTLDGHENGYQTINSANIQEVQKCMTEWNWSFDGYWFVANQKDWNKLDADTQELLMECSKEAALWGRNYLVEQEKEIKEKFKSEYGVTITELSDDQLQAFKAAARPAQEYFIDKFGEEVCAAWGLKK